MGCCCILGAEAGWWVVSHYCYLVSSLTQNNAVAALDETLGKVEGKSPQPTLRLAAR